MIGNLQNLISKVFYTTATAAPAPVVTTSSNPFGNPFVITNNSNNYYGKNNPMKGGYFAGYYNGQPNIVGKRLFIEV